MSPVWRNRSFQGFLSAAALIDITKGRANRIVVDLRFRMCLATPLAPLVSKGYHYWPYSSSLGVFLVGVRNRIHHQVSMILRLSTANENVVYKAPGELTTRDRPRD